MYRTTYTAESDFLFARVLETLNCYIRVQVLRDVERLESERH